MGDRLALTGSIRIAENTVTGNGGGVYLSAPRDGVALSIQGASITGNQAANGGGVYLRATAGGTVDLTGQTVISGNMAVGASSSAGGGLWIQNSSGILTAVFSNVSIRSNRASGNGGGIYSAEGTGRVVIQSGSQITENSAASGGGIYHAGEWVLALEDVTIDQNTAPTGQGVYNDGPLELGPRAVIPDGLYLPDQAAVPTIVGHLSRDSVVQLERSDYVTPDQTGTPIVAAQSDLELVGEDAVVFRTPPTGFAGWWFRVSDDRRQILLTPVEYHLYYENTLGVGNPNPDLYTSLTPTIELLPLTDTPGDRFLGWYAAAEGGDRVTQIPQGSTGDKTLYARWQTVEYTVTYNGNDAGGPAAENVPPSQQVRGGESALLSDECPTRAGYTFLGWNTDPGGAGTVYPPGGTIPSVLADTGLYAQWEPLPPAVHMLTYHGNDAGGPAAQDVPGPVLVLDGQGATLASTVPTRAGFVFTGWNTDPMGAGAAYPPGGTVSEVRADMELYAQWVPLPPPAYNRLTYCGNDAGGPPACRVPCDQQVPAGQYVRIARCAPCRACYCFTGWSTDPCGRGPVVRPGQTIGPVTEDISLYAQWRRLPPPKTRYICRTEPD